MVVISVMGFVKGDYKKLVAGVDSEGRICGNSLDPKTANFPKTYYFLGNGNSLAMGATCVTVCPSSSDYQFNMPGECQPTNNTNCEINLAKGLGYSTIDVLGHCVPRDLAAFDATLKNEWDKLMMNQGVATFYKDLEIASTAIYISFGLGLVYTIVYLYLMSNCAHLLAYVAIGLLELLFITGMAGSLYGATKATDSAMPYWIAFASIGAGFLIFNCMLWCYWSKLQVAIAVIDATADFMVATKRIALVTIYYFFLSVIVIVVWSFGLVGVVAMNEIKAMPDDDGEGFHKVINFTGTTRFMAACMFFCIVWIICFIREKTKFIYMISAAQFYFTSSAEKMGSSSVLAGMMIAHFKHAGSIALGSLLHTIVFFVRLIVDAIVSAAESKSGNNGVVVLIGCLLKCCVGCLESLIEYLNTTAYAFMAISGDPYCKSAWNGFLLNLKHLVKFYFADTLASMFVFIGMLTIVGLNAGSCYLIMRYGTKNSEQLNSVWVPLIVIIITTLITAELFIGFFHQAVRATLMCLAVDIELNGECKFGSPSFHEKMDSINGKLHQEPEIYVQTQYG